MPLSSEYTGKAWQSHWKGLGEGRVDDELFEMLEVHTIPLILGYLGVLWANPH